jgi:hypothetical protein
MGRNDDGGISARSSVDHQIFIGHGPQKLGLLTQIKFFSIHFGG